MKNLRNFISPHVHVQSLDSASTAKDFLDRELELGTGAMVCTDHGFLGACREVYSLAKKNKLIPILGIEAYHRDDNCQILKNGGIEKIPEYYKYGHLLIHAQDQKAYEALIKKVSDRDLTAEQHGSERKPIFTWNDLEELAAHNCTMSSGCLIGIVSKHLMQDRPDLATAYYEKIRSIAGKNFIVELFPHKCDKNWVSGVFFTLTGGVKLKYYLGKKVRTEAYPEIKVSELAKEFLKGKSVGKLLAVKNSSTWTQMAPMEIIDCKLVQDFLENECRPWAPDGDVQMGANRFMLELAKKYGDKVLISDDAHYAHPDSKIVQEAKLGGMGDSFRFYGSYHRHDNKEVFEILHKELGLTEAQFEEYVENTHEWAQSFKDFKLDQPISLPASFYPKDTLKYFWELVEKHGRHDVSDPKKVERLNKELELIHNNGHVDLLPYFFLAEDTCADYAKTGKLAGPGRGSAAGLYMNYVLNVTHIDPIKYDLSLDRFLTLDRILSGKLPDIDMDFSDRNHVIQFLKNKFGPNVAQISTRNLLRLKSALKDVARFTWGEVPFAINQLCETIANPPQGVEDLKYLFGYKQDDGKEVVGYFYRHEGLQAFAKAHPKEWNIVIKILKITRSLGRHASALVVADKPIDSFIPLITISKERATQYTAQSCEDSGAIKMDYLSVNSLKDIESAMAIVRSKHTLDPEYIINDKKVPVSRILPFKGVNFDIYDLPEEPEVYEMIMDGDVETVFQLGTNSAKKGLRSFSGFKKNGEGLISNISDGGIFIALDRPGPLDAVVTDGKVTRNMLEEYAARARGKEPIGEIKYISAELKEAFGVIVYQEHLTKIYRQLTGCSGIEGETFRSDIGKKKMDLVEARKPSFIEKASLIVGKEDAEAIWDQIVTFGQYGFNKSHAISYFDITYATAFLKKFYPIEWWAGVLQNADKDEIEEFWPYCKEHVVLPDIQHSTNNFYVKEKKIISPLSIIKGLGPKAHDELVAGAPYKDIEDFTNKIAKIKHALTATEDGFKAGRSQLNSAVIGKLVVSGVMDSLFPAGMNIIEKLEYFNMKLAESLRKKRPEKINEKFAITSPLQIYQMRKDFLAIYSSDLIPSLYNCKTEGVIKKTIGVDSYYNFYSSDPKVLSLIASQGLSKLKPVTFVNGRTLNELNTAATIEDGQVLRVAVAAYVQEESSFSYDKKGKDKKRTGVMLKAKKYKLDVDGFTKEYVKWPEYNPPHKLAALKENVEKCIVIAILSKRKELTDFNIDAIIPIQSRLQDTTNGTE